MTMGNLQSTQKCTKESDFTDDLLFKVPEELYNENNRKNFYEKLEQKKMPQHERNTNWTEHANNNRLLERVMLLCLSRLTQRSFDYNVLFKEVKKVNDDFQKGTNVLLKEEKAVHESQNNTSSSCLQKFLNVMICAHDDMANIKSGVDVKEQKEKWGSFYSIKHFKVNQTNQIKDQSEKGNRDSEKRSKSDESYRCVTIHEETIRNENITKEDTVEPTEQQQNGSRKNSLDEKDSNNQPLPEKPTDKNVVEMTEKEKKRKENDAEEFEKLIRQVKTLSENDGNNKKIAELNNVIKKQKDENKEKMKTAESDCERLIEASSKEMKKQEENFRHSQEEKERIHKEEMAELRKKREELEGENERIRIENLTEMKKIVSAFWKCVELQQRWEMKKEEWEDWLNLLRSSLSKTKIQFSRFEGSVQSLRNFDEFDKDSIAENLALLHRQTLFTHDLIYESYFKIKQYSEQFPDRVFLMILKKQLSEVSSKISSVLYGVDSISRIDGNVLEIMRSLFHGFDSTDIFYTSKLREQEKFHNPEEYQNVDDPLEYKKKNGVNIEEMETKNDPACENGKETDTKAESDAEDENHEGSVEKIVQQFPSESDLNIVSKETQNNGKPEDLDIKQIGECFDGKPEERTTQQEN